MEHYELTIGGNIKSKKDLFAVYTDNIFLGESGIERWSSFYDLLYLRLVSSNIKVIVNHGKDFKFNKKDMDSYHSLIEDIKDEAPEKISFNFS